MKIMAAIQVQDWVVVSYGGQLYPKKRNFARVLEVRKGELTYQVQRSQRVGILSTKGLHCVSDADSDVRVWASAKELVTWTVTTPGYGTTRRVAPSAKEARARELRAIGERLKPGAPPAVKTKTAEDAVAHAAHRNWSPSLIVVSPVFDSEPFAS